jgi:hypothetical protein
LLTSSSSLSSDDLEEEASPDGKLPHVMGYISALSDLLFRENRWPVLQLGPWPSAGGTMALHVVACAVELRPGLAELSSLACQFCWPSRLPPEGIATPIAMQLVITITDETGEKLDEALRTIGRAAKR